MKTPTELVNSYLAGAITLHELDRELLIHVWADEFYEYETIITPVSQLIAHSLHGSISEARMKIMLEKWQEGHSDEAEETAYDRD